MMLQRRMLGRVGTARAIAAAVAAGEIVLGDAERLMALLEVEADLASLAEIEVPIAELESAPR